MKTVIFMSFTILVAATYVSGGGFDCSKATTSVEKLICSDETVSKLDDELAKVYRQALHDISDKKELKSQQRTWGRKVRNSCKDIACLKLKYDEKISALKGSIADAASTFKNNKESPKTSTPDKSKPSLVGRWSPVSRAFLTEGDMVIGKSTIRWTGVGEVKYKVLRRAGDEYFVRLLTPPKCYDLLCTEAIKFKIMKDKYYPETSEPRYQLETTFFDKEIDIDMPGKKSASGVCGLKKIKNEPSSRKPMTSSIKWLVFSPTEHTYERELVIKHEHIKRSQLKTGRIYIALKDLNDDGVKEIFAYVDIFDYCGQQDGCSLYIYTINKVKLLSIGPDELGLPMFIDYGEGSQKLQKLIGILPTKTSGWHDIYLSGETVWKWNGKHY